MNDNGFPLVSGDNDLFGSLSSRKNKEKEHPHLPPASKADPLATVIASNPSKCSCDGFSFDSSDDEGSYCKKSCRSKCKCCSCCPCKDEIAEVKEQGALTKQKVCDIDDDIGDIEDDISDIKACTELNKLTLLEILNKTIENGVLI